PPPTSTLFPYTTLFRSAQHDDIGAGPDNYCATTDYVTQVFLVSPTGSNQTYTSDATWNNISNSIETLGAGGGGNGDNELLILFQDRKSTRLNSSHVAIS